MTHDQLASDAVELLPCPWCGGQPEYSFERTYELPHVLMCLNYGCKTHPAARETSREDVNEAWNARTPPPATVHNDDQPVKETLEHLRDTLSCNFTDEEIRDVFDLLFRAGLKVVRYAPSTTGASDV